MDIEDYKKIILEYETRSNKDLVITVQQSPPSRPMER